MLITELCTCSLNLVIVRTAIPYGPYVNYAGMFHGLLSSALVYSFPEAAVIPFIAVAACYGYLKQPMKAV